MGGNKKPLKCFSQWKKEDTFSGFPVIVLHLKRVLNSTQAFFLVFCSGGMEGRESILRMLTRVLSCTDFPKYLAWNSKTKCPLFWASGHIQLNNLDRLNRKLNFYVSRKVEKKKSIEIIEYILNNFINLFCLMVYFQNKDVGLVLNEL